MTNQIQQRLSKIASGIETARDVLNAGKAFAPGLIAGVTEHVVSALTKGGDASHGQHDNSPSRKNQSGDAAPQSAKSIADSLISRFEHLSNPRRKLYSELNLHLRRTLWWAANNGTLKLKRGTDIVGASVGILALSPVFLSVIAAIKAEDGGSIIYTSTRVGRYGKEFDFYKFRSMVVNAENIKDDLLKENESEAGVIFKMKDDPRITKVGKFIRRTSMDELPQLFNVLRGDMSLVGPRPPIPREVEQYKVGDRYRLEVIPGLTCLWQVKGRSNLDFHQQVELDREYIHEQTLLNDILLIFRTVPAVLSGQGSY